MRNIGKFIRATNVATKSWKKELQTFLRNYRTTPYPATKVASSEVLFGSSLGNWLPGLHHSDAEYKLRLKEYSDQRLHVTKHDLRVCDRVYFKHDKILGNRTHPLYETEPYMVIAVNRPEPMVTAQKEPNSNSQQHLFS